MNNKDITHDVIMFIFNIATLFAFFHSVLNSNWIIAMLILIYMTLNTISDKLDKILKRDT